MQTRENCLVNMVVSYLEIYNDRLYDLLLPYKKGSKRCASVHPVSSTILIRVSVHLTQGSDGHHTEEGDA